MLLEADDRRRPRRPATCGSEIENAILAVWRGEAESDGLNQLTAAGGR